jgi:hypothetical protein
MGLFLFLLGFGGFALSRVLKLPSVPEGEYILDYKSGVYCILSYTKDRNGRIRFPVMRMAFMLYPLLNWLFGIVSVGTLYVTNRNLLFDRYPGYVMPFNKGKSFSIELNKIKEIHRPKFVAGIDLKDEIYRFSGGRIDPDDAETVIEIVNLAPPVSTVLFPFTTLPRILLLPAKLTGAGFLGIVDNSGDHLFWLNKPDSVRKVTDMLS